MDDPAGKHSPINHKISISARLEDEAEEKCDRNDGYGGAGGYTKGETVPDCHRRDYGRSTVIIIGVAA